MMFGRNTGSGETWRQIPKGSVGVEIGVWRGDSSEKFLRRASHLHLVDPWSVEAYRKSGDFGGFSAFLGRYSELVGSSDPKDFQDYYERIYKGVKARFRNRPVTIHRCTSEQFFASFAGPVDWVYIDGDHSEEGCFHDLMGSLRIVDRYVFGDDYGTKEGVTRAVDRVVEMLHVPFKVFGGNQYRLG